MLKGIKISKIAFIISFFSLFFFGLVTNVEAYCYCSGSSKVCYSGCEAYTNIRTCTTGCPGGLYCYDTNGTSLGVYCCDYKTTTNCSCGCSGGSCNTCCTPSTSCNCSPLSSSSTSYGSKTVTCSNGCGGTASSTCWCTGNCTPQSCPSGTSESGTHGTYATYTCTNECNKSNSRTCKCISACTPTSCPTGTTETNTGDSYSSYSCTNMCSESQTRNCYCSICTPPSCSSSGYSDTDLGCGQVSSALTPSCRNGQGAPDQLSKCDITYRTCYLPKYSITVNGNGGTCSPTSQSKCSGTASSAVTCSRSGYTFSGFTITSGSCSSFDSSTGVCSSVTQPITIQANWTVNLYPVTVITVEGNGGTCTPGTHTVPRGSPSQAQTCTRQGYTFSGFTITSGSCGGTFNSSTGVCSSVTQSITIKANWSINSYLVTVDAGGGTCSPGSHYVNYGNSSSAQTCSRAGYTCGFTITSGSCSSFDSSTGVCSSVTQPITIQANWTVNLYPVAEITVEGNGGTCTPGTHTVPSGSPSQAQTCTRQGYIFSGFTITSGSCSSFNTSTGVCSSTHTMTIKANWSINSYLVSVNGNGGTCSPGSHYVNSGSASSAQTCSRTGYTFSGFTITSGSCSSFNASTGVCSSVTQDLSIRANWSINSYYVSVSGNGGTCSPGSHYVDYGNPSSSQTCSRTGYTFSGFTITSGSCGGSFTSSTGVCSKVTGSIAIRANWQCIPISCNCSPLSSSSTPYGSKTVTCSDGCGGTTSRECWCTNNCTPQSCPSGTSESGTHGTYATYICTNECNKSSSRTCKCINACAPTSCPAGTTETNTGDNYSSYSCTNMCSESQTRSCYCKICTPLSCSSAGYNDTNLGYGQVPLEKTPSCRNGYNAPNYISKCDMTYRTCYCPSCLKQCPSSLANTGDSNLILSDFRECTNDCDVKPPEDQDDCYEILSDQPTESLVINKFSAQPNDFGFLSLTHTGDNKNIPRQGDLNDPLSPIKMVATYSDTTDGADDIEGMFVWFREEQYAGGLGTPVYISDIAEPKASANDSWGFMLRKNGTADWEPYVPSYQGENIFWTKAIYTTLLGYRVFYISGPNAKQMVEVTILNQPKKEGDNVTMEFSLRFSDSNGVLYNDPVAEGKYNIYLMGLDKFSFTPYDNYDINYGNFWSEGFKYYGQTNLSPFWQDNQLRYKDGLQTYARDWRNPLQTWTIDRMGPYIETFAFGIPEGNELEVHWNVNDDRSLYAVIGNIYTTAGPLSKEITLSTESANISLHDPHKFFLGEAVEENIGKINGDWAFKVKENIGSASNSGQIKIDVGDNTSGLLEVYLTVFDDAGNMSNKVITINIADWFATAGGVAYSAGGTNFSTKDILIDGPQILSLPYPSCNPGLSLDKADNSSELWAEGVNSNPESLVKSLVSKSYNITRYLGYKLTEGYYDYLKKEYIKNKQNVVDMGLEEVFPESPILSGSLNGICNNEPYCMFEYTGDLEVKGDAICDNRSVIFVGGNLTIDTPLKNTSDNQLSNKNGCMFVVKGNVTVKKGANMSSSSLGYDIIHGYILADGIITIDDERPKEGIIDGIYINGGLSSSYKGGVSIIINRHLRVEEKLTYPVLVIDYHPKYGVIAEKFFGRRGIIQSVEIGVKP